MENIYKKIGNATKWSSLAEILAKLITPVTSMILARLLTPDAFGVVATVAMIFSFADMFTDSGFQKYLVQHEFNSNEEMYQSTTVAFWTNLTISFLLWGIIIIFSDSLAALVGNPGLGKTFRVACISLPVTSFSSIQMALYRRNLEFKTLFVVRITAVLIPLVVSIPLAIMLKSYWALIIGTICGHLSNAIILTVKSKWKPNLFFRFHILKQMLAFSIWSLVEAVSIWLTNYIGIFIVGVFLSTYHLGLYKTSMHTVNQIMTLITAATTPILFASLSRMQNNFKLFEDTFFKFQRHVGMLVIPMGVGIFMYHKLMTNLLLGSQWVEASEFIGLWALISSFKIVLSNYCSEVYRSVGRPRLSVMVQVTQIVVLIPLLLYGAKSGFEMLYILRSFVVIEMIIVNLTIMYLTVRISPRKMILNIVPFVFCSIIMALCALGLQHVSDNLIWSIISIFICVIIYFISLYCIFPETRSDLAPVLDKIERIVSRKVRRSIYMNKNFERD
ncbi:lipopolysaccharide biosynthesis protein [Mobilitalea sibirica]|uniref:Lipopolysaccharide biosynthesis protein n=1 Tax=Mobilitalea sibirica TaxID=1462919 RepID=A0A8J7KVN5_9FIRM|nr:lipopolysaccharide biosynthesis protein [Mobilitalea sibirica]MBH1939372.1 lipopolysaccharide biosynthesis protein [Mobilitalea sibirica]